MEVSPKTFREVEFREKMRGYHPEDVDQFLEQMAAGVEVMQDRLRQAVERAQRAEQAANDAGTSDETLRRTLVLAQRTADLAVQESREQAARILSAAEQQAQALVAEAEDRARRMHGEALADVHSELAKLEATRAQAQQEVDVLSRWADENRAHLTISLQDALAMIDRADILGPPPTSTQIEVPYSPPPSTEPPSAYAPPAQAAPVPPEPEPEPAAAGERVGEAAPRSVEYADAGPREPAPPGAAGEPPAPADAMLDEDDDGALHSFFEDNNYDDDRKFGGRLRRRR